MREGEGEWLMNLGGKVHIVAFICITHSFLSPSPPSLPPLPPSLPPSPPSPSPPSPSPPSYSFRALKTLW